jgi:ABC-2 type transport system permease protein
VLNISKRELLSLFVTPLAYLVGTLFLLNQGYNFWLLLNVLNDPLAAPGPVMQFYFGGSFFIFWLPVIFICSALSMRLIAEERRQGTLEALLTAPLTPGQLVLGKFLGAYTFYVALWLPTGVFYVLLRSASAATPGMHPEVGPIASGYLGTALVGASFLAIGLLASAVARTQLAAALATFVSCSIVLLAGLLVDQVDTTWLSQLLELTSLLAMMQELAQGIVDGRWVYFHLAATAAALGLATVAVNPRRDWQSWIAAALWLVVTTHAAAFGARHAERQDWTEGQIYTLSERAEAVLQELEGPIDATVIVPANLGGGQANPLYGELREVLRRMAGVSPALRIRMLDPDRSRQEAEALLDDFALAGRELADGVVLIRAGKGPSLRRAHLLPESLVSYATGADVQANGPRVKAFLGEEALLGKFLEVSAPRRIRLCHTQGHGEPEFDNLEPYAGYAHLGELLKGANLLLEGVTLDDDEALSGCDLLMFAGPDGPVSAAEAKRVGAYLESGGDLLVLAGATILRGKSGLARNGLEEILADHGIRFGDRVVLDPHPMQGASPLIAFTVSEGWMDHPATRSLIQRPVSFVQVREMSITEPAQVLLEVGADGSAWAEADVDGFQVGALPEFDAQEDRPGPLPVVAASDRAGSRVLVVASDQFALNAHLRADVAYDHGRDLILNSVAWLTQRPALLGIRPRAREHVKLVLQDEQMQRMSWICLVALPGFALGLGLLVLWRRRG